MREHHVLPRAYWFALACGQAVVCCSHHALQCCGCVFLHCWEAVHVRVHGEGRGGVPLDVSNCQQGSGCKKERLSIQPVAKERACLLQLLNACRGLRLGQTRLGAIRRPAHATSRMRVATFGRFKRSAGCDQRISKELSGASECPAAARSRLISLQHLSLSGCVEPPRARMSRGPGC